jgi:hypothetical protein
MRHLLLLGALLLPLTRSTSASAQPPPGLRCPGENTVEMRFCAAQSWEESDARLRRKLPEALHQQWQDATRAVCSHAYAPFRDGTIYPQLVVGCDDHLNRALLKEFAPLNNQGDPERMP